MYDNCMIVGEEFKNVTQGDQVTGFQIGMRIPYYRGIVLSLLGETRLTVDGDVIPRNQIALTISGKTLPLATVDDEPVVKWEFGDVGILTIHRPGGLKPGAHTLHLYQHVRTPYIPGGVAGEDTKVLMLPA